MFQLLIYLLFGNGNDSLMSPMGFSVTRERVRQAVRESDPIQTALRWRDELVRRQCVLDGFSRLVVYLKCSSNNRASTVYDLFLCCGEIRSSSRIRCDQGKENIHVARLILWHRGEEKRSVLVGSSVHNQRIECPGGICPDA